MVLNKLNNYLIIYYTIIPIISVITDKFFNFGAAHLAGALSLVLFLLLLLSNKNIKIEKYYIFYFLFFIYQTMVDYLKVPEYSFNINQFYFNSYLIPIFVFLIIENTYINEDIYNKIIKYSKLILIIAVFVIAYQVMIDSHFLVFINYIKDVYNQSNSYHVYPSIYSRLSYLGTGLIFLPILALIIGDKLYKNEKNVLIWYILGTIFAFLTLDRWVMLNMLTLFLMYIVTKKINPLSLFKLSVYTLLILIAAYFIMDKLGVNINEIINHRVLQGGFQNNSAYSRILAFQFFGAFFPKNPVFGHGFYLGNNLINMIAGRSSQIHVGYLSLLYYWGITGGMLYFLFLYFLFKKLYRISRVTNNWGPFFGWLCFLLANLTLVSLGPDEVGLYLSLVVTKFLQDRYILQSKEIYSSQLRNQYVFAPVKN